MNLSGQKKVTFQDLFWFLTEKFIGSEQLEMETFLFSNLKLQPIQWNELFVLFSAWILDFCFEPLVLNM